MAWGFDIDGSLRERTQHAQKASAAGDADNRIAETIGSSEAAAVDVPSAAAGRVNSDPDAATTPDVDQGHGEDLLEVLLGKAPHELSHY